MKEPVLGFNKEQSFVEFSTTEGLLRFGKEGLKLFVELGDNKQYITNDSGMLIPEGLTVVDGLIQQNTPLIRSSVDTVTIAEYGDGFDMTTVLTLANFIVGHIPAAAAALSVGNSIASFPSGGVHVENIFYQSLSLTCLGTAVNADLGIGSLVATGGANATLQADGATTEDRLTGQTTPTAIAGGTVTSALVRSAGGSALNIATSVKDIFLNAAGTWNVNNHGDLTATGTIVIKWTKIV